MYSKSNTFDLMSSMMAWVEFIWLSIIIDMSFEEFTDFYFYYFGPLLYFFMRLWIWSRILAQNLREGKLWWNMEELGSTQLIIKMFEEGDIVDLRQPTSFVSVSSEIRDCWFFLFLWISRIRWQERELKLFETNSWVGICLI